MRRFQNSKQKEKGVDQNLRSIGTVIYKIAKNNTHSSFLMDEHSMRLLKYGEGKTFKCEKYIKM